MITETQIKALDENELAYLYYCLNTEWNSLNMGYDFNINMMKCFRNNSIQTILNKHSGNLLPEHSEITMNILNKLEANK
jgi:hypothetical protein